MQSALSPASKTQRDKARPFEALGGQIYHETLPGRA